MIWNHYVNIKGLSAPYTMVWALANRPEGGGGNSGGFNQIGFTTLTHALDATTSMPWDAATNASSYNIFRSLTNGGPYTLITNVWATTFTATALTNGVMYYYVVRAANAVGESPNSIQVSARPVSGTRPVSSADLAGNQLQLRWPADHTGWRLQMNTNLSAMSTTDWLDVAGSDETNSISIPLTNGNAFFRLVYP